MRGDKIDDYGIQATYFEDNIIYLEGEIYEKSFNKLGRQWDKNKTFIYEGYFKEGKRSG